MQFYARPGWPNTLSITELEPDFMLKSVSGARLSRDGRLMTN